MKPKWQAARIKRRPALRLLDRGCEILLRIDRPFSEACPGESLNLIIYLQPVQLFGWMQLLANTKCYIIVKFGMGSPERAALLPYCCCCSNFYYLLTIARCAAVYCTLQQCRAYSHFQRRPLSGKVTLLKKTQPSRLCLLSSVQFRKSVFLYICT